MIDLDFLTQSDIDSPTRLVLARLEAFMIAPNDVDFRRRLTESSEVAFWIQKAHLLDDADKMDLLTRAHEVEPIRSLQAVTQYRYLCGMIAGGILREVVCHATEIGVAKSLQADRFADEKISLKKINDEIWTRADPRNRRALGLRSVSPLWAASLTIGRQFGEYEFPCKAHRLPQLIGFAEFFRRRACEQRTRQSPTASVLQDGELYRLTKGLTFPAAHFVDELPAA